MELKKITLLFLSFLIIFNFISASQTFERGKKIDLKVPFEVNGSMASGSAWCNISIQYPNSSFIFENEEMNNLNNGNFNITLENNQTEEVGKYLWTAFCCDGSKCASGSGEFGITATGRDFTDGEALTSIGILLGALFLSFLFMFLGFKLSENSKALPVGFFFIILSLILGIYSLHLGFSISSDILQYKSISSTASVIYTSFLWLIVSIGIISIILMGIAFIKELGKVIKKKKFGDNFNPLTNTYE